MNDLFTIGEISKHQNISRQTLIFFTTRSVFSVLPTSTPRTATVITAPRSSTIWIRSAS